MDGLDKAARIEPKSAPRFRNNSAAHDFSSLTNPTTKCSERMLRSFALSASSAAKASTCLLSLLSGRSTEVEIFCPRCILASI